MITFCIPSKNNLRYLKHSVEYIRKNSHFTTNRILVYIDADDDGTSKWCDENNVQYILNTSGELFGIGNTYNLLVQQAQTEFVLIYHADMLMGKNFDVNLYNYWRPKRIVSATRIEPPLHPSDPAKVVMNFGLWPEVDIVDGFNEGEFNKYVSENIGSQKVTNGVFAPWLIHKDDFMEVGGHDPIMKSHSEDRDLFNRLLLNGCEFVQAWNSFVYHLTCRGGQFEHAKISTDLSHKSKDWEILANRQTNEFIRKWGSTPKYDEYQYPIIYPKWDISYVVHNCTLDFLRYLEPQSSRIYVSDNLVMEYIQSEQLNTSFDLSNRVFGLSEVPIGDIVIEFDVSKLTTSNVEILKNLHLIIKDSGDIGQFELDIFKIKIYSLVERQLELIKIP
jgi:hypothetical protein